MVSELTKSKFVEMADISAQDLSPLAAGEPPP